MLIREGESANNMLGRQSGEQGGNLNHPGTGNLFHPQLVNVDHLLPLPLQDFCLLRVINDLSGYPVELLASLPRWLRYRLLNNLPTLDLCRLDHTAVATGIDVDQIWETRLQTPPKRSKVRQRCDRHISRSPSRSATSVQNDQSLFHLDIPQVLSFKPLSIYNFQPQLAECSPALKEKITSVFKNVREMETLSARDKVLLNIASNFLYRLPHLDNVHHILVSVSGESLLPNLVFASHHQSIIPTHSNFVWRKQATPLIVQNFGPPPPLPMRHRSQNRHSCIALTPNRLVHSSAAKGSAFKLHLLSLLANDCGVQPTSANICVDKMSQEIVELLYTARVARENGFNISADCTTCISIMHHLLSKVRILKSQCKKYAEVGVMIELIEAVIADQTQCHLQYLFCTMPDLYADVVYPLSTVFSLQNFSQLSLDLDEVYLPSLGKLLLFFLTAPCPGTQQLCIFIKGKAIAYPSNIAELGTLNMKGATLPHCAIHHKMLEVFPQDNMPRILYVLLQWPMVRLNKLVLTVNYEYLHLCALHPDLQVMKLLIIVDEKANQAVFDTVQIDLVALLKMPTLEEFAIAGFWDHCKEAKAGVIQGLRHRSSLPPLRRIHINEAPPVECTEEEYQEIWKAIFSLPQLDQLEIVLNATAKGVLIKYLNTVFASWVNIASGTKLKAIKFQSLATNVSTDEIMLISHFTQTHSFLTFDDLFEDSEYHP